MLHAEAWGHTKHPSLIPVRQATKQASGKVCPRH
jgi:hypothetical protein